MALLGVLCAPAALLAQHSGPAERQRLLASAVELRDQQRWLEALGVYENLAALAPDDDEVYRLRTLTLADVGAAEKAWQLYRERPRAFSTDEAIRLRADRVARLVVWGSLYPASEATRLDEMAYALAELDGFLAELPADEADTRVRMRLDRLLALNGLERHSAAVEDYDALRADGVEIPPYALARAGDSLLARRERDEAIDAMEQAVEGQPEDFGSRLLLGYAYLEGENHDRAIEQLQMLSETYEPWVRLPGARYGYQEWRRYDADHHLALLYSYGDRLEIAQDRLGAMAAIAPANSELQARLGEIFLRRGWAEQALERSRMAQTLDPRSVRGRIIETEALVALARVDAARPAYDQLIERYPGNVHVQRLETYWQRRHGWRWTAVAAGSRSDLDESLTASPLGSRDLRLAFQLESPLLADRWRITGHAVDDYADFAGTRVHHTRLGLGAAYEFDRLDFQLTVSDPIDDFSDSWTFGLEGGWRFDEVWRGSAALYRTDPAASLQARRFGITADSAALALEWEPSDLSLIGLGLKAWEYTDGNRREQIGLHGIRRISTRPHLQWIGLGELYASQGSREDAPYFNPSQDWSWMAGLRIDHLAWRRYERHFRHKLSLHAGQYWQEGYGTAWVPKIEYRHEWGFGMGRILDYGVAWSQPVYDGRREERFGVDIGFRWGEW